MELQEIFNRAVNGVIEQGRLGVPVPMEFDVEPLASCSTPCAYSHFVDGRYIHCAVGQLVAQDDNVSYEGVTIGDPDYPGVYDSRRTELHRDLVSKGVDIQSRDIHTLLSKLQKAHDYAHGDTFHDARSNPDLNCRVYRAQEALRMFVERAVHIGKERGLDVSTQEAWLAAA